MVKYAERTGSLVYHTPFTILSIITRIHKPDSFQNIKKVSNVLY